MASQELLKSYLQKAVTGSLEKRKIIICDTCSVLTPFLLLPSPARSFFISAATASASLPDFCPLPAHQVSSKLRQVSNNIGGDGDGSEEEGGRRILATAGNCPSTFCSICPTASNLTAVRQLTFPGVASGCYTNHVGQPSGANTCLTLPSSVQTNRIGVDKCCSLCLGYTECSHWTWSDTGSRLNPNQGEWCCQKVPKKTFNGEWVGGLTALPPCYLCRLLLLVWFRAVWAQQQQPPRLCAQHSHLLLLPSLRACAEGRSGTGDN